MHVTALGLQNVERSMRQKIQRSTNEEPCLGLRHGARIGTTASQKPSKANTDQNRNLNIVDQAGKELLQNWQRVGEMLIAQQQNSTHPCVCCVCSFGAHVSLKRFNSSLRLKQAQSKRSQHAQNTKLTQKRNGQAAGLNISQTCWTETFKAVAETPLQRHEAAGSLL